MDQTAHDEAAAAPVEAASGVLTPSAPVDQTAHDEAAAAPVEAATGVLTPSAPVDQTAHEEAAESVEAATGVFVWVTTLVGTLYE